MINKILQLASKKDTNGNNLCLSINTTTETYRIGYNLYICDSSVANMGKQELIKLEKQLIWLGFKRI